MLAKINEFINKYVVRTIIEKIPFVNKIFEKLRGHKTQIGRIGLAVTVCLQSLIEFFPKESLTSQSIVFIIGGISWLFTELGIRHAQDVEERGLDYEEDYEEDNTSA